MSTSGLLAGRVGLVTGTGSTLGAAVVSTFLREGAIVVAADQSREAALCSLDAGGAGEGGTAVTLDVTSAIEVQHVVHGTAGNYGGLDILVCCAEVVPAGHHGLHLTGINHWQQVFDVNLRGSFLCCGAAIPEFLDRSRGVIVLSASTASFKPQVDAAYDASKSGPLALNHTVALRYAARGVRCNAVATPPPGTGRHELNPEVFGAAYAFLSSDEATYITGSVYVVDGGESVLP